MSDLKLKIIALDRIIFKDTIQSLTAPGKGGLFGILPGHMSLISSLEKGTCKVKNLDGSESSIEIKGGVLSVHKNDITILAEG